MTTSILIEPSLITVEATSSIPSLSSSGIIVTPTGIITATTLQGALEQLADQSFRTSSTPTGSNIEQGDTWYNTTTETFNVYRETSVGVFQWVPILVGSAGGDSDTLDAGAF